MIEKMKPLTLDVFNEIVRDVEQKTGIDFSATRTPEKSLDKINKLTTLCRYMKLEFRLEAKAELRDILIVAADPYEGVDVSIQTQDGSSSFLKNYTL